MGQRHQVYAITNQGKFAWHCQWSYGTLPLHAVKRILVYNQNTHEFGKLSQDKDYSINVKVAIHNLLSTDHEQGFIGNYHDESDHLIQNDVFHPEWGDNNDGITILDLREEIPKYCFMRHIEWEYLSGRDKRLYKKPLTPYQYVSKYYTKDPARRSKYEQDPKHLNWDSLEIDALLQTINNAKGRVLSLDECAEIMPEFMADILERRAIKKADRSDLPLFVNSENKVNKRLVEKRLKEVA